MIRTATISREFDFSNGNYGIMANRVNDTLYYYAVKYDKSANKITCYYKSSTLFKVSPQGYISQWKKNDPTTKLTLNIIGNTEKKVKTMSFNVKAKAWTYWNFAGSEYCAVSLSEYDEESEKWSGNVYLIDHNGKMSRLKNYAVRGGNLSSNYMALRSIDSSGFTEVYSFDGKKTYTIFGKPIASTTVGGNTYELTSLGSKLYGTKAAATYTGTSGKKLYALVDVSTGKFVSKKYYNMVTYDGKIFRVRNSSGQYGYINASGKELGWFDDAAAFAANGKYAPVFKNGKVYLVDRSMNKVSKEAELSNVPLLTTLGDSLYTWFGLKGSYIMTYKQ